MGDTLRYVALNADSKPETLIDLNDRKKFWIEKGSLKIIAPGKQPVTSTTNRRYGGSYPVGETTDNGAIEFKLLACGVDEDDCLAVVGELVAHLEASPWSLLLEWKPDGATRTSYHEVRGTGSWTPEYLNEQFRGAKAMVFTVNIPIAPLARGLSFDIADNFISDTRSEYTYDSGESADETVENGSLEAVANLAVEKRAIHTIRGYTYADNQQTLKATPGTTISGFKAGVVLKRIDPVNYLSVYVDDNGTNSRLRIDKVVAGTRTNLASTNLAARISTGTVFWVRGRIESSGSFAIITAEYFTTAPTPLGAPTATTKYELKTGAEFEAFGGSVKGSPGRTWVPQSTNASIDEYSVEPYTYRNATLPAQIVLTGSIPGDAPAKADVTITPSGGSAAPIWALLGWTKSIGAGLAKAPFGVLTPQSAGNLSGWSLTADGTALSGSMLKDTSALSSDVYSASWSVDPSLLVADDFSSEVGVEVWARVMLAPTIITPSLTLSSRPEDGLSYGSARYTDEWGSAGKLLVTPSSGTGIWRMVRLGTLRMLVDPLRPRRWLIWLSGSVGATTSGAWGVDYLLLVPAAQRACSISGKANDSSYPAFVPSTAETSKTIKSDLSALIAKPPSYGHPDHGLGGQLLELPSGEVELLTKLSSLVPDDPTASSATEQMFHTASVHVAVTPRWYLTRSA